MKLRFSVAFLVLSLIVLLEVQDSEAGKHLKKKVIRVAKHVIKKPGFKKGLVAGAAAGLAIGSFKKPFPLPVPIPIPILKEHHHHPDFHHGDFHHHGGYGGFDGGYGGSFGGFAGGGGWGDFGGWGLEGHDEMGLASENNEAKFALGE